MRLDAYLAGAGVASRRAARDLILEGRVRVGGRVVRAPGHRLEGRESVAVDGRPVQPPSRRTYIVLHKPTGYLTTAEDPRGRPTVAHLLPRSPRLFSVGRLDFATSGLLFMTDDGEWAALLEHPRGGLPRVYEALVRGRPDETVLRDLEAGIPLADGLARLEEMRRIPGGDRPGCTLWHMVLREGRYREIRRLMATVGHPVEALRRVGFGPVRLGDLPPGKWRHLGDAEVRDLRRRAREASAGQSPDGLRRGE